MWRRKWRKVSDIPSNVPNGDSSSKTRKLKHSILKKYPQLHQCWIGCIKEFGNSIIGLNNFDHYIVVHRSYTDFQPSTRTTERRL